MTNIDLLAAIKNALDRGETLEKAKQTLINAGYPIEEVETATTQIESRGKMSKDIETKDVAQRNSKDNLHLPRMSRKKLALIIFLLILALSIAILLIINF